VAHQATSILVSYQQHASYFPFDKALVIIMHNSHLYVLSQVAIASP